MNSLVKVLILDDDPSWQQLMTFLLSKQPEYVVKVADNLQEARKFLEKYEVDIVIADLNLPTGDGTGLSVISMIRELDLSIPVIAMTGGGDELAAMSAMRRGAVNYIPKNRVREELIDVLHSVTFALDQKRLQNHLMDCVKKIEVEYELGTHVDLVLPFIDELRDHLLMMNELSKQDKPRILLCAEEAILNAIIHGNLEISSELRQTEPEQFHLLVRQRQVDPAYCERKIWVRILMSEHDLTLDIHAQGQGFDFMAIEDPTSDEYLQRPSGRGLLLIKSFMDQVIFSDGGRKITMKKRIPALKGKPVCVFHQTEVEPSVC
ncbi:MAG: response regulator [Planctomycetaceae bacterium]|nr:response regulator [Planctomycetaceae bacterium]